MLHLSPLIVDCINGRGSIENLKKVIRGLIGMKDEDELIDDYARSEMILSFNKHLNESQQLIITGTPFQQKKQSKSSPIQQPRWTINL